MAEEISLKKKILIVDDLSFMREAIKAIIGDRYSCLEAENGLEGVDSYKKERPNAVLLDITMPVMDGIEALQQIRLHDPRATVLMCSALGQEEYILKAIRSGAKDFIVKPFRPERILSALEKALRFTHG